MKRILSILAVVCLLLALAVPAFADEVQTVSGVWEFSLELDNSAFQDYRYPNTRGENVNFTMNNNVYSYIEFGMSGNGAAYIYVGTDLDLVWTDKNGWYNDDYRIIDFGDTPQPVSDAFYTWLLAIAERHVCDGSTCPASDVNEDNVCDDCGSPLAYNLRNDVYDYNGYYFPVLPSYDNAKYRYGFLYHNPTSTQTMLHLSTSPVHVDGSSVLLSEKGSRLAYTLEDGAWVYVAEYNFEANATIITNKNFLVWSTHDVYNVAEELIIAGDSNFRFPLWVEMGLVTQGEMTQVTDLGGMMKLLVLCGVGLMAFLVVLKLFGKRSLLYRG